MATQGYIKLYRQIQYCCLWQNKPYAYGQAWIDLLLLANHDDVSGVKDSKVVVYKRGTVTTSMVYLSDRWGWNRKKTLRFFDILRREKMVTTNGTTRGTTITIVNYDVFQGLVTTEGTTKGTTSGQLMDNSWTHNKNVKNDKNVKNVISMDIPSEYPSDSESHIPYQEITDLYNSICVSLPKATTMSEKRKKAISARWKTYKSIETFRQLFTMAEDSKFLRGANNRDWHADLDWLLRDANMAKVLEGRYIDRDNNVDIPKDEVSQTIDRFARWAEKKRGEA